MRASLAGKFKCIFKVRLKKLTFKTFSPLQHVREKRKEQLARLKDWEKEINVIDKGSAKLVVENDVDLEGPPRQMKYINAYKPSQGIVIPDDPPLGCECEGGSCELRNEKTCCPSMNGHIFPYNKYGKLRIHVGAPIYECNKRCKCGPNCSNRVVQKGRKVREQELWSCKNRK